MKSLSRLLLLSYAPVVKNLVRLLSGDIWGSTRYSTSEITTLWRCTNTLIIIIIIIINIIIRYDTRSCFNVRSKAA